MPLTVNRREYVVINGVPMMTDAWEMLGIAQLRAGPTLRGSDRIIPGATGVIAYPRRATVTLRTFPFFIYGAVDSDGNVNTDPQQGVTDNYEYLFGDPRNPGALTAGAEDDGTVIFEWHRPDLSIAEAHVTVLGLQTPEDIGVTGIMGTLDLSFRDGGTFVGSS